jgi:hypothetical protein
MADDKCIFWQVRRLFSVFVFDLRNDFFFCSQIDSRNGLSDNLFNRL